MSTPPLARSTSRFSEEIQYRSVDPLAVLALLAGIACVMAVVFSPFFLFLGVIGVFLGIASLVRIGRSDSTLSGFWAASLGIGLSVLFLSSWLSYAYARSDSICEKAKERADSWIQLIQNGKYREAHQLTRGFFKRQLPGVDLVQYYDPRIRYLDEEGNIDSQKMQAAQTEFSTMEISGSPYEQMSEFYANPTLTALKEMRDQCSVRFVRVIQNWRDGNTKDYIELEYEVTYEKDGKVVKAPLGIRMLREVFDEPYGAQWAVDFVI